MVFEKIVRILADFKDIDAQSITPESTFEQLALDSLDRVELIMNFEEEFNIQIEMNESIRTIQDLVDEIEKLCKAQGRAIQ